MAGPVDGASLDNLYSLLSKYGVTANEGIAIESDREHYAFQAPFALLPDLASSAITDSLIDERYLPILPLSLGLTVGEDTNGATVTPLLTTSDASYSKLAGYELRKGAPVYTTDNFFAMLGLREPEGEQRPDGVVLLLRLPGRQV